MPLELSLALTDSPRTRPLLDGRIGVEGVRLLPSAVGPGDMFARQLKYAEFDMSEMSMSSYIISTSRGARDWVGVPVFTWREFFHVNILVREDSPLQRPEELKGKRLGVIEYQQTAVIWVRGVLQNEFGVRDVDCEWFMERNPNVSHGGATGFAAPPGVTLHYVPQETSLGAMLTRGELDAILFYPATGDGIDKRPGSDRSKLRTRTLFPDPLAEGRRYYAKTGLFPINHGVVIRRSLVEQYPWLPGNLYAAFVAARKLERETFARTLEAFVRTGALDGNLEAEPMPYGTAANRRTLETVAQYVHEQRLTDRVVGLDEVFAPTMMST